MKEDIQKENIEQIASSINAHSKQEIANQLSNRAFARAYCTIKATYEEELSDKVFWLVNSQNTRGVQFYRDFTGSGSFATSGAKTTMEDDGQPVYKNTKLGEILTKAYQGTHHYTTKTISKKTNDIGITIHNRSVYSPCYEGVEEIEIRMAGDSNYYRFQKLSDLLKTKREDQEELRKKKEELQKLKEEQEQLIAAQKIAAEKEAKERAEKEEQERLEAIRQQKEVEERQRAAEIKRLEDSIHETNQRIKSVKSFLRKSVALRSQHLLDPYQEDAKRSHIYDGVPIVIEGGPGTGKTTTVIQRLKFLLDRDALDKDKDGYDSPLTSTQIAYLTDPQSFNSRWLFFSPTDLLLHYLRNNMNEEGLNATDENTRTLPRFRQKVMRDYGLFDPSKDGPFKNYKMAEEEPMIIDPMKAINEFEKFCIDYSTKTIVQRISMQTSKYQWHPSALRIKSICSHYNHITDLEVLMRLFNSLRDNERSNVKVIEDELKQSLNTEGIKVKQSIMKDENKVATIRSLFDRWRKERIQTNEDEEDWSDEEEEEEEEMDSFSKQEFEAQLFSQIKKLLKQMALRKIDNKIKLSKRNSELIKQIENTITEDIRLDSIGEKAWFTRNFASLCRGIESNLIKNIPVMYKAFRRSLLVAREKEAIKTESGLVYKPSGIYKDELLEMVVKKDANKHLHPDEQNLLIGFINNMLFGINKKSKLRFQALTHKYAKAYVNNVKPVIGIDEATDYSLLDYYFMVSFRHYDFSSITLCGDIMQGLNGNGIHSWKKLQETILPKLEVKSLNISYRQLPTLLDLAREMYKDDQNEYPAYQSDKEKTADEPKPLLFISSDEEEKAQWISNRILDIFNAYDKELPSVAIFVGDDVDIKEFIDRIVDLDMLNGIEVVDCSGNNTLQNKEMVRVFRLSEVKGMEFEAVFFYDIDQAIKGHSADLMRRFLYVGISRATSHLAATMCSNQDEGNIIKYFDTETEAW